MLQEAFKKKQLHSVIKQNDILIRKFIYKLTFLKVLIVTLMSRYFVFTIFFFFMFACLVT